MPDNKAVYNTANKITIMPTNRSNENPKTIFEHSAVQPAFKTLTVPIKKLSQTSKMGPADVYGGIRLNRHSSRRQSLEINLRQEISNFKLLMTSFKSPSLQDVIETLLNKFRAIEELALTLINHDLQQADSCESTQVLSKSLNQISEAYERSKDRLNRDLNKMEYQVSQIRDTRERISMKHIKSLDIVQREVNRIMPNELSSKQSKEDEEDDDMEFDE